MDYRNAVILSAAALLMHGSLSHAQLAAQKPAAVLENPDQHITLAKQVGSETASLWSSLYFQSDSAKKQEGRDRLLERMNQHPSNPYLNVEVIYLELSERKHCNAQAQVSLAYRNMAGMMPSSLQDWPDRLPERVRILESMVQLGINGDKVLSEITANHSTKFVYEKCK